MKLGKLLKAAQVVALQMLLSLNAFAISQENIGDANAGGSGSDGTIKVNGGFHKGDNGYRIYIVDANEPTVISNVIDMYLNDDPLDHPILAYQETWVGNASANVIQSASFYNLDNIPEPIIWNGSNAVANGENLKKWMLQPYGGDELNSSQATNGLYLAYQLFGEHDKKALDALTTGEAKLVIEAVYWYRPNNNKNEQILNNGQEFYVYGTIKNIATWEQANADLLGNQFGGNMKSLTSKVWTTALKTIRDEEQWGLYTVSRSDQLTYDEILEPYGYGIQVYESTDIAERTQTYDESLSVEGPAPQMPALPDGADPDVLRPITIIKLYTNKHTDGYGQVTKKYVGCFMRTDNCRTIKIMNETLGEKQYTVKKWATSTTPKRITKWDQVPSKIREQSFAKTITCVNDEKVLYVWLVNETREPSVLVDLELRESEITRAFESRNVNGWGQKTMQFSWGSMAGTCDEQVVVGGHMEDRDGDGIGETYVEDTAPCGKSYSVLDGDFNYILRLDENINQNVLTLNDKFKSILEYTNGSGTLTSTEAGTHKIDDQNIKFVIWRGQDIPTLVPWKDTQSSEVSNLIGTANTVPNNVRKDDDYSDSVLLKEFLDKESQDLETTGGCTQHNNHEISVEHSADGDIDFAGDALIKVYQGEEKGEATDIPDLSELQSVSYKKGQMVSVKNTWIKADYENLVFYPYIRMTWQSPGYTKDQKNNVNILSQHISSMKAQAAVQISWNKQYDQNGFNMYLKSDQWSLHAQAVNGDKKWNLKNQVLPGGAIHAVQTKGDGTKDLGATINVKGYYPFISDSMKEKVISYDARWSQDAGRSEMESLVKNIEKTINENYKLQMYVDNWQNNNSLNSATALNGIAVKNGTDIQAITGNWNSKAAEDLKYYLQETFGEANSNNVNAHASKLDVAVYTFSSDVTGNILMNGSVILKKNEGVERLSGAAKEIDDNTKVVTNLVNSLVRNKGNDKSASWAESDGHWYNEAFDGVSVAVYSANIEVGVDGYEGLNYRTCVLDPNLTPSSKGQQDAFSKANIFQYTINTNNKQNVGTVLDQNVNIPNADQLLVSRYAFIPNVNVQNID